MKKQIIFLLLFACLSMNAQTLLVDDFKSGALAVFETSSATPTMLIQSGTGILGGNRYIIDAFSPNAVNDLVFIFQPTSYRFGNDFAIKRIWFD